MHDGLFDLGKQPVLLLDRAFHVLAEKIGVPHAGILRPEVLQVAVQCLASLIFWQNGNGPWALNHP